MGMMFDGTGRSNFNLRRATALVFWTAFPVLLALAGRFLFPGP